MSLRALCACCGEEGDDVHLGVARIGMEDGCLRKRYRCEGSVGTQRIHGEGREDSELLSLGGEAAVGLGWVGRVGEVRRAAQEGRPQETSCTDHKYVSTASRD